MCNLFGFSFCAAVNEQSHMSVMARNNKTRSVLWVGCVVVVVFAVVLRYTLCHMSDLH